MENSKIIKQIIFFCGAVMLTTSCVKDDIYNTPHPSQGAVMITTDWSRRSTEATQPVSYQLRISDQSEQTDEQSVKGNMNLFHSLLAPETYELLVYNSPEAITVSDDVATITSTDGKNIESSPGYLFSAAQTLDVVKDDTLFVTVAMRQRIRQLTLILKLKDGDHEHIIDTKATLNGVASNVNLKTGALPSTSDASLVPVFKKAEESDGTPVLTATFRLLGIAKGEVQKLHVAVTLNNGTTQMIETDLTEVLHEHFNGSMDPLVLGANFDLPSQTEFSGSITDWSLVEGGQVDIH